MKGFLGFVGVGLLVSALFVGCAPTQTSPAPDLQRQAQQPKYDGPIQNVAVLNVTAGYPYEFKEIFGAQIEQGFFKNPYLRSRFNLIERSRLDAVLREQGLALTGLVNSQEQVKLGKLLGANYILLASLSSLRSQQLGSIALPGIGGVSGRNVVATVNLSLVDAESGKVIAKVLKEKSKVVPSAAGLAGVYVDLGISESALRDILAEAVNEALAELVEQIR
jgi:curli biogenesis system outer membrane secretion channel CsgG